MAAPAPLKRPKTADHLMSAKKPIERKHTVYHDDDSLEAFKQADINFGAAKLLYAEDAPEYIEAKTLLDEARAELEANTTVIHLRGIGRKAWAELKMAHPPTDEQNAEIERQVPGAKADWNPDTFIPALIALSSVDPVFTLEQAQEIANTWTDGELTDLYAKCLECNQGRREDVLGKF